MSGAPEQSWRKVFKDARSLFQRSHREKEEEWVNFLRWFRSNVQPGDTLIYFYTPPSRHNLRRNGINLYGEVIGGGILTTDHDRTVNVTNVRDKKGGTGNYPAFWPALDVEKVTQISN